MHNLGIDSDRVDWDLVKDADNEALRLEAMMLMPSRGQGWDIPVNRTFKDALWFFDPDGMTDMSMSEICYQFEGTWNDLFTPDDLTRAVV